MHRRSLDQNVRLLIADIILTVFALYLASLARLYLPYGVKLTPYYVDMPWGVYVMAALVWLAVSAAMSVYTPRRPYVRLEEVQVVASAVLFGNLTFAGLLYLTYRDLPRLLFLYSGLFQGSFLLGVRLVLYAWRRLWHGEQNGRKVLIVGAGKVGQMLAQHIRATGSDLTAVGYLDDDLDKRGQIYQGTPVLGGTDQAARLVRDKSIDEVLLALPLRAHQHLEALVMLLQTMPVQVRVVPDFFDLAFFRATIEDFGGIPLIGLRDPAIGEVDRLIKRLFDLALSTVGIVLLAPLMALLAIVIRLDSPGPALFRQQRVGENGRLFTIYKFRSMIVDAEARQQEMLQVAELHKRPDDPRVTRIGHFIRRTSLDELPQLFNVIKGDMSLVGPRPELPWLVERYESWQRKRLAVPPGITGWWQINGRSDRPMHLNTEDDLYYIQHYSPLMDLHILWRTIGAVLRGRGAY